MLNPYDNSSWRKHPTRCAEQTKEAHEDTMHQTELLFLEMEGEPFRLGGEQDFLEYLKTRHRDYLYDSKVWGLLTKEEQDVREESYNNFFVKIVGRLPQEYKPRPLSEEALLSLRKKYKRTLGYLCNKLFHSERLMICDNDVLEEVLTLYRKALVIIEEDDKQSWYRAKERWENHRKEIEERWNSVLEKRKQLREEAKAQRAGKLRITRAVIQTEDSWRQYLNGVTNGVAYECALRRVLNDLGFACLGTKASGDQGVDLILRLGQTKVAIQCKFYKHPVGNAAIQEVFAGKEFYKCSEAWVITNSTYTSGAKELAGKTGVKIYRHTDLARVLGLQDQK